MLAVAAAPHEVARPLWVALVAATKPASVEELRAKVDAPRNSVEHRLWLWERAGIVTRHHGKPVRYAMSDTADRAGGCPSVNRDARVIVRKRPARSRLWSAMRVLNTFDLPQLSLAAGGITPSATAFLKALSQAGYFRELRAPNKATGEPGIYRLARNTGPTAPTISTLSMGGGRFARCVVDRNNGEVHELPSRASRDPLDGGVS